VFRKHTKMDTDTPSRAKRTEQGRDGGAIFVSNFPPTMTQEELLEALEPFGKYEKLVMRIFFAFLSLSC
jgi:RNA recognition motif-containing protein